MNVYRVVRTSTIEGEDVVAPVAQLKAVCSISFLC